MGTTLFTVCYYRENPYTGEEKLQDSCYHNAESLDKACMIAMKNMTDEQRECRIVVRSSYESREKPAGEFFFNGKYIKY